MAKTTLSLKLLVDKTNNRVLFAEAGKDFVDFLFHLLSLPIASVTKLINANDMVGCIGDIYTSVESLNSDYFQPNIKTDSILNPKTSISSPLLSLTDAPPDDKNSKSFYMCSSNAHAYHSSSVHKYVTDSPGQLCPKCRCQMSINVAYVVPEESVEVATSSNQGYVKSVVTYMVMDHLAVKPMSTISGINLINEFGVKDISSLIEKQVQVTLNEGLAILKASLETRAVLTKVFLASPDQNQSKKRRVKRTQRYSK